MFERSLMMRLMRIIEATTSPEHLASALVEATEELGFQHFALTHHIDILAAGGRAIRLHNYPERWANYYDHHALGVSDPVHRASHMTSVGFRWSQIPEMIPMTIGDWQMLERGRAQGIGDGFTVPAHVPGEAHGSVSFANRSGRPLPEAMLPITQLVGNFAFEAARRLWRTRRSETEMPGDEPQLTDRQRDCALWVARGKTDWEISRILTISEETVARHVSHACDRYRVNKRTLLIVRTLFDGTITFGDIFRS